MTRRLLQTVLTAEVAAVALMIGYLLGMAIR